MNNKVIISIMSRTVNLAYYYCTCRPCQYCPAKLEVLTSRVAMALIPRYQIALDADS